MLKSSPILTPTFSLSQRLLAPRSQDPVFQVPPPCTVRDQSLVFIVCRVLCSPVDPRVLEKLVGGRNPFDWTSFLDTRNHGVGLWLITTVDNPLTPLCPTISEVLTAPFSWHGPLQHMLTAYAKQSVPPVIRLCRPKPLFPPWRKARKLVPLIARAWASKRYSLP